VQNLTPGCTILDADEARLHGNLRNEIGPLDRDHRGVEAQDEVGRAVAAGFFHRDIFIRQKFAPASTYKSEPDPGVVHPPLSRERLN
jgi:hypothetical protein